MPSSLTPPSNPTDQCNVEETLASYNSFLNLLHPYNRQESSKSTLTTTRHVGVIRVLLMPHDHPPIVVYAHVHCNKLSSVLSSLALVDPVGVGRGKLTPAIEFDLVKLLTSGAIGLTGVEEALRES